MKYTGDDERLREMDESELAEMVEWLIDGNDPEDMAATLLEHMSDDEIANIQKALADEKVVNTPGTEPLTLEYEMKDVTIQLELTVPKGLDDQEIKSFVEAAITKHLISQRMETCSWDAIEFGRTMETFDWGGILGIDQYMTDVVAITEGYVGALPGWRDLSVPKPHGGAVLGAINNLPDLTD